MANATTNTGIDESRHPTLSRLVAEGKVWVEGDTWDADDGSEDVEPETDRAQVVFGLEIIRRVGNRTQVKDDEDAFWVSSDALDEQVPVGLAGDELAAQYADWCSDAGASSDEDA